MTDQQPNLDTIETRANAATKGPWFAVKDGTDANVPIVFVNRTSPKGVTYSSVLWNADWATEADAEFTAHAREDVEVLVAEVRRLRAQLEDQADADTVADRAAKAISAMGADLRAMTSERNRYRTAWRLARTRALSTGGAADRYASRAREGQTALQDMFVALLAAQMERDEAQAEAAALKAVLAKAHTDAAPAARSAAV